MKLPLYIVWSLLASSCFPGAAAQETTVREIMVQWTIIERSFLASAETPPAFIRELEGFSELVRGFLGSRMYRMYRYMPFPRPEAPASPPNDPGRPYKASGPFAEDPLEEFKNFEELIRVFTGAALEGDRGRALEIMADIRGFLIHWQFQDLEAEKSASASYFALFLIFTFFLIAAILVLWFLHRGLERSISREQAGSLFSRALVLAQEQERSRIAGELHDTVAQDLRYLSLRIGKIGRTSGAAEREKICGEVAAAQENLIGRVRSICDNLAPPDFHFQGLPDALRRLCYDFGGRTGIDCRMDMAENLSLAPMNEEMQLQAFRIVQEALNNVEKHAGAAEAVVTIRNSDRGGKGRGVFISVSDDGRGFQTWPQRRPLFPQSRAGPVRLDRPPENMAGHFGIRGMFERCAILNGTLVIESEEGEGTMVYLEAPLDGSPGTGAVYE